MKGYVDSGVLIKLYVKERNSAEAARAVSRIGAPVLTPLHELEIRNALRALEGRGLVSAAQQATASHVLEADILSRRLRRASPDWTRVYEIASMLSQRHTPDTLARSLDILHVAAAIAVEAGVFVTADSRQAEVARRAGLEVTMVE